MKIPILALLMLVSTSAFGQEWHHVLLPIYVNPDQSVPGARGTSWTTELWVHNQSEQSVGLFHAFQCFPSTTCSIEIPPESTVLLNLGTIYGKTGAMIRYPSTADGNLHLSLGLRELSSSDYFVAHLPVIHESDLFDTSVEFVRVPVVQDRRLALRVYDPDARNDGEVLLEVFDENDQLLAERTLRLWLDPAERDVWPLFPQVATITDLKDLLPEREDAQFLRIRLTPTSDGLQYWGFISSTHNESQDVDIILPD